MRKILFLSAVAALAIAAPAVRLDEVSVSAQKIDENASEVAAAVNVLGEKELRLREAKDLNGLIVKFIVFARRRYFAFYHARRYERLRI